MGTSRQRTRSLRLSAMVLVAVLAAGLGAVFLVRFARAQPTASDPVSVVQRGLTAVNSGDAAAATAVFGEHAIPLADPACSPTVCIGQEAIGKQVAADVAARAHFDLVSSHVDGNSVSGRLELIVTPPGASAPMKLSGFRRRRPGKHDRVAPGSA